MPRRPAQTSVFKDLSANRRAKARARAEEARTHEDFAAHRTLQPTAPPALHHLDTLTIAELEGLRQSLGEAIRPEHEDGNQVLIAQIQQVQAAIDARQASLRDTSMSTPTTTPQPRTRKTHPLAIVPDVTGEHPAAHAEMAPAPSAPTADTPAAPAATLAPVSAPAADTFQAKVATLLALAQQGADAVAEALRAGTVSIRLPRTQAQPTRATVVKHPTAGLVARNKAAGIETARAIRPRHAAGEALKDLADEYGIKMGTMYDIIAQRVYREKQA